MAVEELPEHVETYDVFLSFTRASPGAADRTEKLEEALTRRGLRVFRDVLIDDFASITAELVTALAGSKVLVAYYSREYPGRYACQWELTAAFLAAQREGDPRRRVLVVNPERAETHIRPIELKDAKYASGDDAELERLADRIAVRVRAVRGPLGAQPHPVDRARLPAEVLAPDLLVGRYPEMWDVHTFLHGMDLPGVHKPAPEPAVVVTGLPGMGKSSLAARYAYLYRDAYPGGVFWTGPFDADTFLGSYTGQLRRIAEEQLGLPVGGVGPDRLRTMVADALSNTGEKVLWVVDGIPPALSGKLLRHVLIPAHNVRTILTSRAHVVDSDVPELALSGLEPDEACLLLGVSTSDGVRAAEDFARRCGGHPVVVRAAAAALRYRPGPVDQDMVPGLLRGTAAEVGEALAAAVAGLNPLARQVLRVAAVLAPAPFPPGLVHAVVTDDVAPAVEELVRRGLLHVVGTNWSVHALVSAAAGTDDALAEQVAAGLVPLLPAGDLSQHALRLGKRVNVPIATRRQLLRHVVTDHEAKGDPVAAAEVLPTLLALTPPEHTPATDLITGARVRLASGRPEEAVRLARQALDNADTTDDFRARHRARLLLAQALDQLGDEAGADEACWTALAHRLPGWLSEDGATEERVRAQLALASAISARGAPRDALEIVEPIVVELRAAPPGPLRDEVAPLAKLELARLLQLTGKARVARERAEEVVQHFRAKGMGAHAHLLDAEGVLAAAFLTLDLTELNGKPENWRRSEQTLRELAQQYEEKWGKDSAVAIAARVRADRALLSIGEPRKALHALAETEELIIARLGRHRLLYRVRHGKAQAHGQLGEYDRLRDILLGVLPEQTELLGRNHPETLETKLELGIAYAMTGERAKAIELVDSSAAALRRAIGADVDPATKATVAQPIVRLPSFVLRTMGHLF